MGWWSSYFQVTKKNKNTVASNRSSELLKRNDQSTESIKDNNSRDTVSREEYQRRQQEDLMRRQRDEAREQHRLEEERLNRELDVRQREY